MNQIIALWDVFLFKKKEKAKNAGKNCAQKF